MPGMLEIESFTFGPFQTNTYVVSDEQGNILLIDPACFGQREQQQLQSYIESLLLGRAGVGLSIMATHGHLDHLWGAPWATEQFGVPVLIPEADIPMVEHMQEQYDLFGINLQAKPFPIAPLNTQPSALNAPLSTFTIIPTPGHTPGSICLYNEKESLLFSGDTLFRDGYGRTDLPGGNMEQLIQSLKTLWQLPSGTQVYPGHDDTTLIG